MAKWVYIKDRLPEVTGSNKDGEEYVLRLIFTAWKNDDGINCYACVPFDKTDNDFVARPFRPAIPLDRKVYWLDELPDLPQE